MPDFNWKPLREPTVSWNPKINEAIFGDGYSQRTPQGINNNPEVWDDLSFIYDDTICNNIISFFESKNGVSSFTWQPPKRTEGTYICKEWSRTHISKNISSITAKFEQVF